MLNKGDKGVNDAAHPLESSAAEAGAFWPQPVIEHWQSNGDTRQSTEKTLHEAAADSCHYLPTDRSWNIIIVVFYGRGRSGTSRGLSPAGLCWSSSHFELCAPDEPSWTWTQTWVQAWMPDYRLN